MPPSLGKKVDQGPHHQVRLYEDGDHHRVVDIVHIETVWGGAGLHDIDVPLLKKALTLLHPDRKPPLKGIVDDKGLMPAAAPCPWSS